MPGGVGGRSRKASSYPDQGQAGVPRRGSRAGVEVLRSHLPLANIFCAFGA